MTEKINDKIKKIDNLLQDENLLNNYINNLESEEIEIPKDLEMKILNKIQNTNTYTNSIASQPKIIKNKFYLDILKIAVCTVFAVFIFNVTIKFTNNDIDLAQKYGLKVEEHKKDEALNSLDQKIQSLNSFFMKPINIERNEK